MAPTKAKKTQKKPGKTPAKVGSAYHLARVKKLLITQPQSPRGNYKLLEKPPASTLPQKEPRLPLEELARLSNCLYKDGKIGW